MSELVIYHNGMCSKCHGALELLQEKGIPHTVRWYLTDPLTEDELSALLQKLQMKASDLVRRNEDYFKTNLEDKDFSEEEWIEILVTHPELMQRPIIEHNGKAIVARPAERLFEVV